MPIALPPPDEGEEQQPAAVMDIVVAPQSVESGINFLDEGEEQKTASVIVSVPVEPDINYLLDRAQQRGGCISLPEDLHNTLVCANLDNPMRGYVDTLCCSRNVICGRENYYPVGASLSNPEKWTCFLNCILQCVVHTVPLVSKLLKDDHVHACPDVSDKFCCYCSLKLHAAEIIKRSGCVLYPKKFVELLKLISENFGWGRHQDAHEFLRCFLDKLDEASVPPNPPSEGSSSIVQQIFGGQLKSQLRCPECNHCSDRLEPFVDLNLEVTEMSSVMDALRSFTKIEVFENFICDGCKSHVNMEKQFKVDQAPEVLVIQLKRFQNLGSDISKIQAMVKYQLELDLRPFMSSPDDKHQNYDLYGVVEHLGVPSNGHYVCYIRPSQTDWFMFDDSKVMKICMDRALDSEAYLLFYVKQGSSPWFSTFLKRKKNVTSDSDEGSYSLSGSDNDEQGNDCSPETSSWCKEDEIRGSSYSPAGALGTLRLRSIGSNSKAMEDEPMKQFKDMVINELCMFGLTGSEIENVAGGIFAEALEKVHMVLALETSRKEHAVETFDEEDEIRGSSDSPAGALGTLRLRSIGSNSKAMEDEPKQFKDEVINELCRSGLTGCEIRNVAAGIFAEALEKVHMVFALETSRKEHAAEMLDDEGDRNGAKKRRRSDSEAEED
ncbi:unnamed protein product [Alopecurus aequalis]